MSSPYLFEELDEAISVLLADSKLAPPDAEPPLDQLLQVAAETRYLISDSFKAQLKTELMTAIARGDFLLPQPPPRVAAKPSAAAELPTLFSGGYAARPINPAHLLGSFALHAAAVVLVIALGVSLKTHTIASKSAALSVIVEPGDLVLPPSARQLSGGGGGGDRDKVAASKGSAPRFAPEQFTPPMVIARNPAPALPVDPTVIGPPQLQMPQLAMMGDPTAVLGPPSNGVGSGGGIGSGVGGGVGSGRGPGVGPGEGGGIGGGVYRVGGGVSAPRTIYSPDPDYSDEARKAKYQGTVVLWVIVNADGTPREIRVARSLGMGLDERAVEAVRRWRFDPARKDGRPVAVQINVEVNFRLY